MHKFFYVFTLVAFASCNRHVTVRYKQQPAETHSTESLAQVMLVNPSPRIVLRVPDGYRSVTGDGLTTTADTPWPDVSQRTSTIRRNEVPNGLLLYNTVEKQLVRDDFIVRDRSLFNDVLSKSTATDYSKLHGLTNTDLILEWINLDLQVGYNTNVCYKIKRNGREKTVLLSENFRRLGASLEFKLIAVRTNEVVGTYRFHYTPCTNGCEYMYKNGRLESATAQPTIGPYEAVDQNELDTFITDATRQLVKAMH
ncbi:hypothetical protein [uncultured Spirosoma sp.]|uniref:hypothetical protein n=1 Tax=uncultured Spirosoma sp. TaxID=278208 RepID=UPI00258DDB3B|nr:hypothetical protein [uncultured Spirosoma sp.]